MAAAGGLDDWRLVELQALVHSPPAWLAWQQRRVTNKGAALVRWAAVLAQGAPPPTELPQKQNKKIKSLYAKATRRATR